MSGLVMKRLVVPVDKVFEHRIRVLTDDLNKFIRSEWMLPDDSPYLISKATYARIAWYKPDSRKPHWVQSYYHALQGAQCMSVVPVYYGIKTISITDTTPVLVCNSGELYRCLPYTASNRKVLKQFNKHMQKITEKGVYGVIKWEEGSPVYTGDDEFVANEIIRYKLLGG